VNPSTRPSSRTSESRGTEGGTSDNRRSTPPEREEDSEARAHDREQEAFGRKLPQQAEPTRSHGDAGCHFPFSIDGASEHQVRHVRAGDQQHQRQGAEKYEERGTNVSHHLLVKRLNGDPEPTVVLGIVAIEPRGERLHVRPRPGERHAVFQPTDDLERDATPSARVRGIRAQRSPEIRFRHDGKRRLRGEHADDGGRLVVERDLPAHDRGVAPEAALPERMAQHHDERRRGTVVLGAESSTEHRGDAEDRKDFVRSLDPAQELRLVEAGEGWRPATEREHALEDVVLIAPIEEVVGRDPLGGGPSRRVWSCHNITSCSGSGNGSGRRSTPFTTLKMAVFAPMPMARVRRAMAVIPGRVSRRRAPYRTSAKKVSIDTLRRRETARLLPGRGSRALG